MLVAPAAFALKAAYVSGVGGVNPWSSATAEDAMTTAFGSNWDRLDWNTNVFTSTYGAVYLEGSDSQTIDVFAYLTTYSATVQSWVDAGGALFINAAPNEGDTVYNSPYTALDYYVDQTSNYSSVTATVPSHDIFQGPFLPVGTAWTGSSFAHASARPDFSGQVTLLDSGGVPILGEIGKGSGHMMVGGMTMPVHHSPATEGANLRANILYYLGTKGGVATASTNTTDLSPVDRSTSWANIG